MTEETQHIYITNPEHRCNKCNGREVLIIDTTLEEVVDSNMEVIMINHMPTYVCKNKTECVKNIKSEASSAFLQVTDDKISGIEIVENGKTIFKVAKK